MSLSFETARLTKKKRDKRQIISIMKQKLSLQTTDIRRKIRKCYEQFHMHTYDNLDKMGHILEKLKLPELIQYGIDHLNSSITIKEIEFMITSHSIKITLIPEV